jgi:hypothetical protein
MNRDQQNAILDARGTRRQVNELNTAPQPPPSVINGSVPNASISVVTTETPAMSQAGTQFGRHAHSTRG